MNRSAIRNLPKRALALTLAAALLCPAASANAGSTQLDTAQELADGLTYRNTVSNHSAAGRMESFSLELEPDSDVYPIRHRLRGRHHQPGHPHRPGAGLPRGGGHQQRLLHHGQRNPQRHRH